MQIDTEAEPRCLFFITTEYANSIIIDIYQVHCSVHPRRLFYIIVPDGSTSLPPSMLILLYYYRYIPGPLLFASPHDSAIAKMIYALHPNPLAQMKWPQHGWVLHIVAIENLHFE